MSKQNESRKAGAVGVWINFLRTDRACSKQINYFVSDVKAYHYKQLNIFYIK